MTPAPPSLSSRYAPPSKCRTKSVLAGRDLLCDVVLGEREEGRKVSMNLPAVAWLKLECAIRRPGENLSEMKASLDKGGF